LQLFYFYVIIAEIRSKNGVAKLRIIVISDTHRDFGAMLNIFQRNLDAELFIFLGDGEKELDEMRVRFPDKRILNVAGNCDLTSFATGVGVVTVNNVKIIFTHGHSYGVKGGIDGVLKLAKENKAEIVLFGHTHNRFYAYKDGVHILNPGSASNPRDGKKPSYAFIDITKAGIVCNHVDVVY